MSPQDIAISTGMPPNNIWQLLHKMAQDGEVTKLSRGKYRHPDRAVEITDKDDKSVRRGEK